MKKMHVVTDHRFAPILKPWAEERLNTEFDQEARFIANVLLSEDGSFEVLFCVVLSNWSEYAVEAAAASDGSNRPKVSKDFMPILYDYVFNYAGKTCMYSLVKRDNEKSLKVQRSAGLTQSGVLQSFYGPGKDAIVFGITEQQWLAGKWSSKNSKGE